MVTEYIIIIFYYIIFFKLMDYILTENNKDLVYKFLFIVNFFIFILISLILMEFFLKINNENLIDLGNIIINL